MVKLKIQTWIIAFALAAFGFAMVCDTVCVFLKDSPVELGYIAEEESSKSEKEKDEVDELFFEDAFVFLSRTITVLNYSVPLPGEKHYTNTFCSEIIPPPPKS